MAHGEADISASDIWLTESVGLPPVTADRRMVIAGALAFPAASRIGTTAAAGPMDPLLQSGIAQALAIHRAAQIGDVRYDITLDVTATDLATGDVAITFERRAGSGDLILDFRGPMLDALRVNGHRCAARPRNGHVVLPASLLRTGRNRVSARFAARIAAAGAPIIRFADTSDGSVYLYTLLVPSDANLLFPCFDQPDLKARFRWQLTTPSGWAAVTNGRLEARDATAGGARWRFAATAPIPTYLAAFAAGPWTSWTSADAALPITLYARASRKAEVDVDPQIAANRAAVNWLAEWFGIPFPFAKLDLVIAPAFPFGGMEHVGAVFYSENVFLFREPPTLPQRLGRDATIFHEISHQWFGDLVTMRWFDDLWLKEGFSTYMAARIQADLQPDSNAWTTFLLTIKTSAYRTDATSGTQPLWQALDNLDAAKSNYGPIVYNKAPAIIKQLAFLVGEAGFRQGLRAFLQRHAYANATWHDLLDAIGKASGIDLTGFGRQYVLRAGLPRIDTRLRLDGNRIAALDLLQRPARVLPGDPGGTWPMKVRVRLGYADRDDVVVDARFDGQTATVREAVGLPAPDYVWANDGDQGYGLFMPDDRTTEWIGRNVGGVRDPLVRAMLWNALWDVVRDARLSPVAYIEAVLRDLATEADEQISRVVLSRGAAALDVYLPDGIAAPLRPRWEAALLTRIDAPNLGYGLRKDALDMLVATGRTPLALGRVRTLLAGRALFADTTIRQPTRWAIVRRLTALGTADAAALFAAEQARDTSSEAAKDAFVTRAATPTAAVKTDYFRRYLDDPSLNEAWAVESLGAFNTLDQAMLTLPFLRAALDRVEWIRQNRRIFFLPAWIGSFIGGQTSPQALEIVDTFLRTRPSLPIDIRRKILTARDELDRTIAIRAAAVSGPMAIVPHVAG